MFYAVYIGYHYIHKQRAIKSRLESYMTQLYKYPRTHHLPFSPGATSDDKILDTLDNFLGRRIVITEKMDGECCSLYRDTTHARSVDSRNHVSRNWVKNFHAGISNKIPSDWRVCGENLYAKHSIFYDNLLSYFYAFSVYNSDNICLSWDDTKQFLKDANITSVPVLYDGIIKDITPLVNLSNIIDKSKSEGYVIRVADSFHYNDFGSSVAKWVRCDHVTSDEHWMNSKLIVNKLSI